MKRSFAGYVGTDIPSAVVVTGASGFLGRAVVRCIGEEWRDTEVIGIGSSRNGGVDLSGPSAREWLSGTIRVADPGRTLLIHAAALVEWESSSALLTNAAMALTVSKWARTAGIGFSILVSGVNVYPLVPRADAQTQCEPANLYGLGKWAAERVWGLILEGNRQAVIRLAGLWGWQAKPTLFWNELMLAAARGYPLAPKPVVRRRHSVRNYVSVSDAAACLLTVGASRRSGLFLAAGRDAVDTGTFVEALSTLPGSKLTVEWRDDGGRDERLYTPSPEFVDLLTPFPQMLLELWGDVPGWVR